MLEHIELEIVSVGTSNSNFKQENRKPISPKSVNQAQEVEWSSFQLPVQLHVALP